MKNDVPKVKLMNIEKKLMPLFFTEQSLREKLKRYQARLTAVEADLSQYPDDWGRYQFEFNENVNYVFTEIMRFACSQKPDQVHRLRKFFVKNYRQIFLRGQLNAWSLNKPYGYAGDFWVIDQIYQNRPATTGFERLFDNYFQMSAISTAVRNRKDDFKEMLVKHVQLNPGKKITIMDLASGPGRELKELSIDQRLIGANIEIHCYDHDPRSFEYVKNLLKGSELKVKYIHGNALKMAAAKDISQILNHKYDFIFSTGLFDYLNSKVTTKLLGNLYSALKSGGVLAISDVREKHENPSVYYMEWIGEWELVYNNDESFRSHCHDAGLDQSMVSYQYEQQGILQYVIARR